MSDVTMPAHAAGSTTPDPATTSDLAAVRREHGQTGLTEADLAPDWLGQFRDWLDTARSVGLAEPDAMVVATADADGRPSARTTLLKYVDTDWFIFFTNYESRKATELAANPYASLLFPWYDIGRQVIVCGGVERVERRRSHDYFATRPRLAQIGAWASPQSRVVPDRGRLEHLFAAAAERFAGQEVPLPPHWGGLRVVPETVEFWQGRANRLHDRLRFRLSSDGWLVERLAP